MKSIKVFGLAALAALMAMAFLGASSALATNTQLCKADESTCAVGNVISHVHEQTVAGARIRLLSSLGIYECEPTLFSGDSLGLGAPLVIHGHFFFYNCERELSEDCVISEVSSDSLVSMLKTGTETAEVTFGLEVKLFCNLLINCVYRGTNLKGVAKGPLLVSPNGGISASEQTVTKVSGVCSNTAKLDISMIPLEATYISS